MIRDDSGIETRRLLGPELRTLVDVLNRARRIGDGHRTAGDRLCRFPCRATIPPGICPASESWWMAETTSSARRRSERVPAGKRPARRGGRAVARRACPCTARPVVPLAKTNGKASSNGKPDDRTRRLQKNQELHEVKELEKLFRAARRVRLIHRRLLSDPGRIRQRRKAHHPLRPGL